MDRDRAADARHRARQILADALMLDAQGLGDDVALGHCPQWDSMAHLRLVLGLETTLDRQLTPDEVVGIADLASIAALLLRPAH